MSNMFMQTMIALKKLTWGEWLVLLLILLALFFVARTLAIQIGNPLGLTGWRLGVVFTIFLFTPLFVSFFMRSEKMQADTNYGIVSLELVRDVSTLEKILDKWAGETRDWNSPFMKDARRDIWLDLFFIIGYVAAFSIFFFWAARTTEGAISAFALVLAWCAPLAGLLDLIENAAMLFMLSPNYIRFNPSLAVIGFWNALPKFVVTLLVLLPLVVIFALWILVPMAWGLIAARLKM